MTSPLLLTTPLPAGTLLVTGYQGIEEISHLFTYEIDLVNRQVGGLETIGHGVRRKGRVVLLARETLFLRGSHDTIVDHHAGGRVVVIG